MRLFSVILIAFLGFISGCDQNQEPVVQSPLREQLKTRPSALPENVYTLIVNYVGPAKYISEKNEVIEKVAQALQGPETLRNGLIRLAIKQHKDKLAGLDEEIIKLISKLKDKPAIVPQDVYDAIKNFAGNNHVKEKNEFLDELVQALSGDKNDRDNAIRTAEGRHPVLTGLANVVINLLPVIPADVPLNPKPAVMPQDVYNVIANFGGADKHIDDKNLFIDDVVAAITGDDALRDDAIRAAVVKRPALVGLDVEVIKLLPKVAATPLKAKPAAMPEDVYKVIVGFKGPETNGAKNALIKELVPIITGNRFARDKAIAAVVQRFPSLHGIDVAIIAKLGAVILPAKPAGMGDELYEEIIAIKNFDANFIPHVAILNAVQDAVAAKPTFGADRNKEVLSRLVALGLPGFMPHIGQIFIECVRAVNNVLVPIANKQESKLTQAIYNLIIGSPLSASDKNDVMAKLVSDVINDANQASRDGKIDTITASVKNAPADFARALKAAVTAAQTFVAFTPGGHVTNAAYNEINGIVGISDFAKNVILENVNDAWVNDSDLNRKNAFIAIVQAFVADNDQAQSDGLRIANHIPLTAKFEGRVGTIAEGSSDRLDDKTGKPTYLVIQITRVNSVDPAETALLNTWVYVHPDKYGSEYVTYGDRIYFDKLTPKAVFPDPRGGGRLRIILNVVGFRQP